MAVINGRGIWGVRAFVQTGNWTRPSDWLALNAPTDNTEQFTGLLAITNDDSNYVTLRATTTGNYTVDWGDGTVTTHASGATAEKKYEYSAIGDSTLTSRGYKQVVVKLTGTNITGINTNYPHSALASATNVLYTWLEFHINLPNCTSLAFFYAFYGANAGRSNWVEKITLNKLVANTSFSQIFSDMYSLQQVAINYATTVTNTSNMFYNCYNLKTVPLFNTSNVTTANNMFSGCYSLTTIPSFNFSLVTNGSSMFSQCYSLTTVPDLNFSSATNLGSLFNNCNNLVTAPSLTTPNLTSTNLMFNGCTSLETVPLFDTSKVNNTVGMFTGCYSVKQLPQFNTTLSTNFSNMFENCFNLRSLPLLDTQRVANFTNAFANCNSLDELPAFNLTVGSTFNGMFTGANGISKAPFVNIKNSFSFSGLMLSRAAIVDIFNGLPSGVTAKTITVSANPGYGSLTAADRLIATGKGWTIA